VNGGSGTQYFVGEFDGKTFRNDNPPATALWLDYGADNYAGVTWFGIPGQRKVFIGWMSNWDDYAQTVPTQKWRSAFTVPRDLWLENTAAGYRLLQKPVDELSSLRGKSLKIKAQTFSGLLDIAQPSVQKEMELTFDLSASTAKQLGFTLHNSRGERLDCGYDLDKKELFIDRSKSGKVSFSEKFPTKHTAPFDPGNQLNIRALIDASSVELFVNNGQVAMTEIFFPNEDFRALQLFSIGGNAQLLPSTLWQIKSIWR
jgi:fructan beta-fructosidase